MPLSTAKELFEALAALNESEQAFQKKFARMLKSRGVISKKEDEQIEEKDDDSPSKEKEEDPKDVDASPDEEAEEPGEAEAGKDNEPAEKGKDPSNKKLAGADELTDTIQELPQVLKGSDFIDKINKIRAGKSLKDADIQKKIVGYVKGLTSDERDDLWVNLDSLARIILAGSDPAQVMTPSLVTGKNIDSKKETPQKSPEKKEKKVQQQGPIVAVAEGVKRQMVEIPFVLRSNRTVPFGDKSHIKDLERLLADLMRFRSCQERGSESWLSVGLAIKTVKSQLAHARRKSLGIKSLSTIDQHDSLPAPALIEEK